MLTPFKWGKSALVILSEPTDVTVREERVSILWPLFIILDAFATFFISALATMFIYCTGCLVAIPLFLIWYIRRIVRHYPKHISFTVKPGTRYRLYWDEDEKLAVETL